MTDAELIGVAGLLLAAGIFAAMAADKVRVPGLLLFLGLGMLAGTDGPIGVDFDDAELTRTLGTIGLVLILFEGGLSAGWREIKPVFGVALSLAILGTLATAVLAGLLAASLLDLGTKEGLIVGSAVAATDSAAIFAVLRGSRLRRRVARALEGESGMNDPVALLLVTGFIDWILDPAYGIEDLAIAFVGELSLGAVIGIALGLGSRWAFRSLPFPTPGLYPVASVATAALSYGAAEVAHGSGFFAVYATALVLGTGFLPAKRTIEAFHQGLAWVAQISLFFLLGLLVNPADLGSVALEGLALSAFLMVIARPLVTMIVSGTTAYTFPDRLMLGWAGLRGAIPIWLATFPVVAGVSQSEVLFNVVFFVVVTSTLIQGVTFEPLARKLGVTSTELALPRPLVESGMIRELGGEVMAYRVQPGDAAAGHMVKELGLPREALINVIVRDGTAIPPRGSTVVEEGDELHLLVRNELRPEVEEVVNGWEQGPIGLPPLPAPTVRGAPHVFSVRPPRENDDDPDNPGVVDATEVIRRLRSRRDKPGALVALADGRFAVTGPELIAVGGRRLLARWCGSRAERQGISPQERAWWQEVVGVLNAPELQ